MLARILLSTIDELTAGIFYNHDDLEKIYSNYCLSKLKALLTEIDTKNPDTPLNAELAAPLVALLDTNYRVTKDTDMSPTMSYQAPHTVAYLIVAQALEKIVKGNRYKLLHPDLEVLDYVASGTSLNDDSHEISSFIMSDDGKHIIEIQPCLAFAENDGVLKHTCMVNGQAMPLSPTEIQRVINYLKETKEYWEAITHKVQIETKGESFGSVLTVLINDLRNGGKSRAGEEYKAGNDANVGIINFVEWFTNLEEDEKALLRKFYYNRVTLGDMYDRLVQPANYSDTIYCVEGIASNIETILDHNKSLFEIYPKKYTASTSAPKLQDAIRDMEAKKIALGKAMHGHTPQLHYGQAGRKLLADRMADLTDLQQYISPAQWREWFEQQVKVTARADQLGLVKKFAVQINRLYFIPGDFNRLFKIFDLSNPLLIIDILESAKEKPAETLKDYQFYLESHACTSCRKVIIDGLKDKVLSFEDFHLLIKFSGEDKCKLADKHKKFIDTAEKFWEIVGFLPSNEDAFEFILQYSHFVADKNKFYYMAKRFDEPYRTYLYAILARQCFNSPTELASYNDAWLIKNIKMLNQLLSLKMNDGVDLHNMLTVIPSEQRLFIANHFQSLIRNGGQLALVLAQLAQEHRYPFLRAHLECINDGNELADVTSVTNFESSVAKLQFVESLIAKVTTDEQLAQLLEQFSFKEGCYLMRLAVSKSKTISNPSALINNSLFYTPKAQLPVNSQAKSSPSTAVRVYEGDVLISTLEIDEGEKRFFIDA